jgi:hypothetical protein
VSRDTPQKHNTDSTHKIPQGQNVLRVTPAGWPWEQVDVLLIRAFQLFSERNSDTRLLAQELVCAAASPMPSAAVTVKVPDTTSACRPPHYRITAAT